MAITAKAMAVITNPIHQQPTQRVSRGPKSKLKHEKIKTLKYTCTCTT